MTAAKVVLHESEREHVEMVLHLFAVRVRLAVVAAVLHPHVKITRLNEARADPRRIGIAEHRHLVGPRHDVPALAVRLIDFDELRELRGGHRRADRELVRRKAVARDLRIARNALGEIVAE